MLLPTSFASAQLIERGIRIDMEDESITLTTFNPGPPYEPQTIALGADAGSSPEELHLSAIEDRIDADLALGRHDQLVSELEALVAAYPLRERFRGQLMHALYRAGRLRAALDAYRTGKRLLVEELGLEPSRELRALARQILAEDPSLDKDDDGGTGR